MRKAMKSLLTQNEIKQKIDENIKKKDIIHKIVLESLNTTRNETDHWDRIHHKQANKISQHSQDSDLPLKYFSEKIKSFNFSKKIH